MGAGLLSAREGPVRCVLSGAFAVVREADMGAGSLSVREGPVRCVLNGAFVRNAAG